MAQVIVNLSDNVPTFVSKVNSISAIAGDLALLNVGSDLVDAINSVYALVDTDTDFRSKISVTDAGGDGSLTYNSTTGVITYTGPTDVEVRAHFSAGSGINIASGVISIPTNGIATSMITADAVTYAKLQNLTTGNRLLGGTVAGQTITEVVVQTDMVANNAVTYAKMQDLTTGMRVLGGTTNGQTITEVQVQTDMVADDAITRAKLASEVSLIIYNSAGTALKTLYGAGS